MLPFLCVWLLFVRIFVIFAVYAGMRYRDLDKQIEHHASYKLQGVANKKAGSLSV